MFLVGLISWWYGRGWLGQWRRIATRFSRTSDFFSIGYLFSTLYSPFRQISANGATGNSFAASLRGFFDKLTSRIIGSFVRGLTIIAGVLVMTLQIIYEVLIMIAWWFLPLFPIIGFIMLAIGWVPQWV